MDIMIEWIAQHYIELLGTIFGFLYIIFEIREQAWLWPVGIITSVLYTVVFFNAKVYADMSLQIYYVGISIYGWYWWLHGKKADESKLPVIKVTSKQAIVLTIITVALFVIISRVLITQTDSPIPYIDALTTALSITATWMLARKIIEQWYIWIIVNAISIGVYIYRDLHTTVILFVAYLVLAFVGLIRWKKSMNEQTSESND